MRDQPVIKLYKGYASQKITHVFGHVFQTVHPSMDHLTRNSLKNALEMYRRYQVHPMKYVQVEMKLTGQDYTVKADRKGFFQFHVPTPDAVGFEVNVSLGGEATNSIELKVSDPKTIIISDIDDTVLVSRATKPFRKLYLLLTKNFQTRKAFQGIHDFYQQLSYQNPPSAFFYVSSSEWNLYDFLNSFMRFNELPDGVLLLQNIKTGIWDLFKSGGGSHEHKKEKIETLLHAFPEARFTLVGDSGQKDPYIYRDIALKYGSSIKAIYIRDVRKSKRKSIESIRQELELKDIQFHVFSEPI